MILFCSSDIVEPPNPIFHFPLPFYIFKMINGVECVPHHRMCISNWLIEFIIRYWKSEKASQTSAKFHIYSDWSEKSRKILRSAKCTKGVSQIEPHRISLQFWAKIWLMNFGGNGGIVQIWPRQNIKLLSRAADSTQIVVRIFWRQNLSGLND